MSAENKFCQILLGILDILPQSLDKVPFCDIGHSGISILGDDRLGSVIIPSNTTPTSREINLDTFATFINKLSPSIVRLNHLGIGFKTKDINNEITKIKGLISKSQDLHIYEENSGIPNQKWFFIGNKENWEKPMFEIVVAKSARTHDYWNPHFQIDLDTNLSIEKIKHISDERIRPEFIAWELDVPAVGVVCGMGVLGDVGGTKIAISFGTNKRDTKYFREHILKEVV